MLPPNNSIALYVHIPWCVLKCPYCDFNSHKLNQDPHEDLYIDCLIEDLDIELKAFNQKIPSLKSIFIGGGTPSLFSAQSIGRLLNAIDQKMGIPSHTEITLEANPNSADAAKFIGYKNAGINRLSIGIQSFNDTYLKKLGRAHRSSEGVDAYHQARTAGFENINLDLMYALPNQGACDALSDLKQAINLGPEHISWYQLTLEPNTLFFAKPPKGMPDDDHIVDIELKGYELLSDAGYDRYEISAFARQDKTCAHNLNYWLFGDYLGIGAGAHGKITTHKPFHIKRHLKQKRPIAYMENTHDYTLKNTVVSHKDQLIEFMLNALRLTHGFSFDTLEQHTQWHRDDLLPNTLKALSHQLITQPSTDRVCPTQKGINYLNQLIEIMSDTSTL